MSEKKDKKKIWIYAVILFTSAFVVLLLTAISQIKLNKNIDDYKTQIYTKEKEKSDFQLNLNSSQNTNKKLQEEINSIKNELNKEINVNKDEEKKYIDLNIKFKQTIDAYEKMMLAGNMYDKKDFIGCAAILFKQIDIRYLSENAAKRYFFLKENSFEKASKQLYVQGLNDYRKQNYDAAVTSLQLSVDLNPNEYYSDDCYYYIAYAMYYKGKYDLSANAVNKLLKDYPESSYRDNALDLQKAIK